MRTSLGIILLAATLLFPQIASAQQLLETNSDCLVGPLRLRGVPLSLLVNRFQERCNASICVVDTFESNRLVLDNLKFDFTLETKTNIAGALAMLAQLSPLLTWKQTNQVFIIRARPVKSQPLTPFDVPMKPAFNFDGDKVMLLGYFQQKIPTFKTMCWAGGQQDNCTYHLSFEHAVTIEDVLIYMTQHYGNTWSVCIDPSASGSEFRPQITFAISCCSR